jgi:hypothetical protein
VRFCESIAMLAVSASPVTLKMRHDEHDHSSFEGVVTLIVPRFCTPLPWKVCGWAGGVEVVVGVEEAVDVEGAVLVDPPSVAGVLERDSLEHRFGVSDHERQGPSGPPGRSGSFVESCR